MGYIFANQSRRLKRTGWNNANAMFHVSTVYKQFMDEGVEHVCDVWIGVHFQSRNNLINEPNI